MADEKEVDAVVYLQKEIMNVISGENTSDIVRALIVAICDVLMTTGPNLDETLKVIDTLNIAMKNVVIDCDKNGVCVWN
jgi:hypothetical protein